MAEDHGAAATATAAWQPGVCGADATPLVSTPVQWAPQMVAMAGGGAAPPSFGSGGRTRRRTDADGGSGDGNDNRGQRTRSSGPGAARVVAPEVTAWRLMNAQRRQNPLAPGGAAGQQPTPEQLAMVQHAAEEAERQAMAAAAQARGQTRLTQFFQGPPAGGAPAGGGGGGGGGGSGGGDDAMVE